MATTRNTDTNTNKIDTLREQEKAQYKAKAIEPQVAKSNSNTEHNTSKKMQKILDKSENKFEDKLQKQKNEPDKAKTIEPQVAKLNSSTEPIIDIEAKPRNLIVETMQKPQRAVLTMELQRPQRATSSTQAIRQNLIIETLQKPQRATSSTQAIRQNLTIETLQKPQRATSSTQAIDPQGPQQSKRTIPNAKFEKIIANVSDRINPNRGTIKLENEEELMNLLKGQAIETKSTQKEPDYTKQNDRLNVDQKQDDDFNKLLNEVKKPVNQVNPNYTKQNDAVNRKQNDRLDKVSNEVEDKLQKQKNEPNKGKESMPQVAKSTSGTKPPISKETQNIFNEIDDIINNPTKNLKSKAAKHKSLYIKIAPTQKETQQPRRATVTSPINREAEQFRSTSSTKIDNDAAWQKLLSQLDDPVKPKAQNLEPKVVKHESQDISTKPTQKSQADAVPPKPSGLEYDKAHMKEYGYLPGQNSPKEFVKGNNKMSYSLIDHPDVGGKENIDRHNKAIDQRQEQANKKVDKSKTNKNNEKSSKSVSGSKDREQISLSEFMKESSRNSEKSRSNGIVSGVKSMIRRSLSKSNSNQGRSM